MVTQVHPDWSHNGFAMDGALMSIESNHPEFPWWHSRTQY
jgi:hypothetical protein